MSKITVLATVCALGIAALAAPAHAESIGFAWRSSNGSVDISSQLTTDVWFTSAGAVTTAHFRFHNAVGTESCVTDIYFNEKLTGSLVFAGVDSDDIVEHGDNVAFSYPADPTDPGGAVGWNAIWCMDSDSPPSTRGLDEADDWVQVGFVLAEGATTASVLSAVADGGLALHVQAIAQPGGGDESEWFESVSVVPEPASLVLLALGLGGVAVLERRKRLARLVT